MNYFGAFIAVISSFVIVTAMRKIDCLVVEVFKGEIGFSFYCILFSKKRVEEEHDFFFSCYCVRTIWIESVERKKMNRSFGIFRCNDRWWKAPLFK